MSRSYVLQLLRIIDGVVQHACHRGPLLPEIENWRSGPPADPDRRREAAPVFAVLTTRDRAGSGERTSTHAISCLLVEGPVSRSYTVRSTHEVSAKVRHFVIDRLVNDDVLISRLLRHPYRATATRRRSTRSFSQCRHDPRRCRLGLDCHPTAKSGTVSTSRIS